MKFAHVMKSVAVAAAVVAAAPGFAQTVQYVSGSGTGTFVFDSSLLGALSAGSVSVAAVSPATATMSGTTVSGASAPISAIVLDSGNHLTGSNPIVSAGGTLQTAPSNFAGNGGTLSVTNLGLDLATGFITADLSGGNGVQALTHVDVFQIGSASFDGTSVSPTAAGSVAVTAGTHTLTSAGLTLNSAAIDSAGDNAKQYFIKALGLTAIGSSIINGVTNFGTLTVTGTFKNTTAVPEPSTYAMLGLGLAGLAVASRRRAK